MILKPDDGSVAEVMARVSAEAELVFLGLLEPDPGEETDYGERVRSEVSSPKLCRWLATS